MRCDRCNGATREKEITSKKTAKKYTILECTAGCKNGKYNYSFFPPTEEKQISAPANGNGSGSGSGESIKLLRSMAVSLKNIEEMLRKSTKQVAIQPEEMQPDEETPF